MSTKLDYVDIRDRERVTVKLKFYMIVQASHNSSLRLLLTPSEEICYTGKLALAKSFQTTASP